jgi:hypothetical protein
VVEALRARTEHPDEAAAERRPQGAAYDKARWAFDALWLSREEALKARGELDEARASLYRSLTVAEKGGIRVNWKGALPLAADAVLTAVTAGLSQQVAQAIGGKDAEGGLATALAKWLQGSDTKEAMKLIEREASERYVEEVSSLEQFQGLFERLLRRFGIGGKRRLFVFVDDLDRCLPEDAVAALEAIKLFLNLEGCVFVLGMDRLVVEQGIAVRYEKLQAAGFDARAYLDKIIQVPFNLPPLGERQIGRYLDQLSGAAGGGVFALVQELIAKAAPPNPRALKRVLNALLLVLYLDDHQEAGLHQLVGSQRGRDRLQRLAKLVLLQVCFETAWRCIIDGRCSLLDAESFAVGGNLSLPTEVQQALAGPRLRALFDTAPRFKDLSRDQLNELMTLSKVTSPIADIKIVEAGSAEHGG